MRLYIDSCVFISVFEGSGSIAQPAEILFEKLARVPRTAVTSELTLAELLAPVKRPLAYTVQERTSLYLDLLDNGGIVELRHVSRDILLRTSALRADHPQRLPDAIHIATAIASECDLFVSFDRDARRLPPSLKWITPTFDDLRSVYDVLDA